MNWPNSSIARCIQLEPHSTGLLREVGEQDSLEIEDRPLHSLSFAEKVLTLYVRVDGLSTTRIPTAHPLGGTHRSRKAPVQQIQTLPPQPGVFWNLAATSFSLTGNRRDFCLDSRCSFGTPLLNILNRAAYCTVNITVAVFWVEAAAPVTVIV
jgi:hypothetical protein